MNSEKKVENIFKELGSGKPLVNQQESQENFTFNRRLATIVEQKTPISKKKDTKVQSKKTPEVINIEGDLNNTPPLSQRSSVSTESQSQIRAIGETKFDFFLSTLKQYSLLPDYVSHEVINFDFSDWEADRGKSYLNYFQKLLLCEMVLQERLFDHEGTSNEWFLHKLKSSHLYQDQTINNLLNNIEISPDEHFSIQKPQIRPEVELKIREISEQMRKAKEGTPERQILMDQLIALELDDCPQPKLKRTYASHIIPQNSVNQTNDRNFLFYFDFKIQGLFPLGQKQTYYTPAFTFRFSIKAKVDRVIISNSEFTLDTELEGYAPREMVSKDARIRKNQFLEADRIYHIIQAMLSLLRGKDETLSGYKVSIGSDQRKGKNHVLSAFLEKNRFSVEKKELVPEVQN